MTYQPELDFSHTRENNAVSQKILDVKRPNISGQNLLILELLAKGERITFDLMYEAYKIKHLPRRIKDLEENEHIKITANRVYDKNGNATYFFNSEQKIKAMQILNEMGKK